MNEKDLAMLIDAVARQDADPLTRFVRSLSDDEPMRLRSFAQETIKLRQELEMHVRALLSTEPREATQHAEWVSRNVGEVAYRWSGLLATVQRMTRALTHSRREADGGGGVNSQGSSEA
ncbi:MAG TPA: hypothetical protein VF765_31175 [Polyangiaceae bacterium]